MDDKSNKIRGLWAKLTESPYLMLSLTDQGAHPEPMTAMLRSEPPEPVLYFFARADNRLVEGIAQGHREARATFAAKGHDYFASLSGSLELCDDPALIDELWTSTAAAWFEGGREDHRLRMLSMRLDGLEIWEVDGLLKGALKSLFRGNLLGD